MSDLLQHNYYIYYVTSNYTKNYGMGKLGSTEYVHHRMRVYNTGDPPGCGLDKRYEGIWCVNASSRHELRQLETIVHNYFDSTRLINNDQHATEWFTVSIDQVRTFINRQPFTIRELSIEEIDEIHRKSKTKLSMEENDQYIEELCQCMGQEPPEQEPPELRIHDELNHQLRDEVFSTFLEAGCVPRRIQLELWDTFALLCNSHQDTDSMYTGIVQWATGAGKTFALLIIIVLVAHKCKKEGRTFRGLLIAPTNDIFNTIMRHITKLSKWDIQICEGHNARMSSLYIPANAPVLVTATHASLTELNIWDKLPAMDICHYDEVHRITGEEFHAILPRKLVEWRTRFLTGTSATPLTCSTAQNAKMVALFGDPLPILHRCDLNEAIANGWIAPPRFRIHVTPNSNTRPAVIQWFLQIVHTSIKSKQQAGNWRGGKIIVYLPFRTEVRDAAMYAKHILPDDMVIYAAVDSPDAYTDERFVSDVADGTTRILFACERYREGSDIYGLEMTLILMGNTIGANILLQIAGRALRYDYPGKEGWCVIARPGDEDTTEDEVLEYIMMSIMEFINIGKETGYSPSRDKIRQSVIQFFGEVDIGGKVYDINETVDRLQTMFIRKEFDKAPAKEKYKVVQKLNREMGIKSRYDYIDRRSEHIKYIDDPSTYFVSSWVSWYHYLGVDTTAYPQTKPEWLQVCRDRGLTSWKKYQLHLTQNKDLNLGCKATGESERLKNDLTPGLPHNPQSRIGDGSPSPDLPANPEDMYAEYSNWDIEFGTEYDD
jgi:superfamily II DNA or RNA helicase